MLDLPPYLVASPVGLHVMDLKRFVGSPYKAPVSSDAERRGWATKDTTKELCQLFPTTPTGITTFNLLIYNKSRDNDRICSACRRWYRVGEPPAFDVETGLTTTFKTFDEFAKRSMPATPPDLENDEVAREQDLSGICSRVCMAAINSNDDSQFGLNIDQVTPEQISLHSDAVQRATGWSMRMATPEEEASMSGVKLLYERRG